MNVMHTATAKLWFELIPFISKQRHVSEIMRRFKISNYAVYQMIARMKKKGIPVRYDRVIGEGGGCIRISLDSTQEEALEILSKIVPRGMKRIDPVVKKEPIVNHVVKVVPVVKQIQAAEKKPLKKPVKKPRNVSSRMREHKAPWFVLTTECERLY